MNRQINSRTGAVRPLPAPGAPAGADRAVAMDDICDELGSYCCSQNTILTEEDVISFSTPGRLPDMGNTHCSKIFRDDAK